MQEQLLQAALCAGAAKAVIIPGSQIVLSADFSDICQANQCGNYGKCWVCPPCLPPIAQAMDQIRSYPLALWYQSVWPLEDSFDIEGMFVAGKQHSLLSQQIQKQAKSLLTAPFLHLTCGGCHLCSVCAKAENQACRMPDKALPSLEGYGVDVYNTTKNTPLNYINGKNTVTYFGMVLFGR